MHRISSHDAPRKRRKATGTLSMLGMAWMAGYAVTLPVYAGSTPDLYGSISVAERKPAEQAVKGKVTDEKGESLPGVSILVKGAPQGTTTDVNGEYSLSVPDGNAILVFSFVGYMPAEVTVGNRTTVDVVLAVDVKSLDELIVVGYGTVKKKDLTGSVARIDAEQFKNQAMSNVTDMLTGTVAGFAASQNPSAAGGSEMEVRGPNSLNAGSNPLIVLDGVIYNGSLNDINPNDIATVDILKDASSSAIFGAKAANGVILITTNKGKTGRPTINFTSRIGVNDVTSRAYGGRSPEDYIAYRKGYLRSLVQPHPDYYYDDPNDLSDGVTLEQWRSLNQNPLPDNQEEYLTRLNFWPTEREQYKAGKHIDWVDEVMRKGIRQEYDVSVSGGNENARYYWSAGYLKNQGILKGDDYSVVRSRLNVDFNITEWLNIGTNTQFSVRDESSTPPSLGSMQQQSPFGVMYNEDGTLNWYPGEYTIIINPMLETYYRDRNRKIYSLFSSLFADVQLPFGFKYKISYQPRIQMLKDYNYWSPLTIRGGRDVNGGRADRTDQSQVEWMIDQLVTWNKQFGDHRFDFTFLHNVEKNRSWSSYQVNSTFLPSPALGYSGMQFGTSPALLADDKMLTGDALMGRLNYSLKDRYLFTASIRRDGYSAFGKKNPRATFPALAAAWKLSDESFFRSKAVNLAKVRLSWGVNGNRDIGQYAALATLATKNYYDGNSLLIGITTSTLENSELTWERTEALNAGLDLELYNSRFGITLDLYNTSTTNLLMNRILPKLTGFTSVTTNLGELNNKGIELTLRSTNISTPAVTWSSALNFSMNRNKIVSLFGETGTIVLGGKEYTGELPDITNEWFPGHDIDQIWNYDITGIWQEEEREEAAKYNLQPGDYKSADLDGDGTYQALQDKIFEGYRTPRYRLGLRNDVTLFKNFTASVFLRADLGHMGDFVDARAEHSTFASRSTPPYPYWTEENRSNDWPRLSLNTAPYGGGIKLYKPMSFLRVQDISFGYNLPANALKFIKGIGSVRFFGSARNVLTFTKWPAWDPEPAATDAAAAGFSPMPKNYTIGLNITL